MAYEVTTFDVCVPGFERWCNRDEFILVASVWYGMSKDDLLEQFNSAIQVCASASWSLKRWQTLRPDDFDSDAIRKLVTETMASASMVDVLRYIDPPKVDDADVDDIEQEMEGCKAYLYIRDTDMDESVASQTE